MQTVGRFAGKPGTALGRSLTLGAVAVLALCGCGGAEISGQLSLPDDRGKFRPTGNVEVMLVRGDVPAKLADLARDFDSRLSKEVMGQIAERLAEEGRTKGHEFESLLATLEPLGYPPDRLEGAGSRARVDCTAKAKEALAAARQRLAQRLEELQPQLRGLGIETSTVDEARPRIEALLAAKLARQAESARLAYAKEHLRIDSSVILGAARSADQLCWSVTNNGTLNVVGVDLHLTYDGRRLPQSVAEQLWIIPFTLRGASLVVRNEEGEEVYGLAPGATFRMCLYAAPGPLTARPQELTNYGLTRRSGSRSGAWGVDADNVVLTAAPATAVTPPGGVFVRWEFARQPAAEVFANQLAAYRRQLLETDLLAQLTASEDAKELERSTAAVDACEQAAELQHDLAAIDEARAAIALGDTGNAAVQALIAPRVEEMKQDARRRSPVLSEAHLSIERNLADFRKTTPDGAFTFLDVEDGQYTLIATNKIKNGTWRTWLVPLTVDGDAHHNLGKNNAAEGTLTHLLQLKLFGGEPAPASATPEARDGP